MRATIAGTAGVGRRAGRAAQRDQRMRAFIALRSRDIRHSRTEMRYGIAQSPMTNQGGIHGSILQTISIPLVESRHFAYFNAIATALQIHVGRARSDAHIRVLAMAFAAIAFRLSPQ